MQTGLVLHRAEVGLQHHVEIARLGVLATSATVRAGHLVERDRVLVLNALAVRVLLGELVGSVALVAAEAFDQRVAEDRNMSRGHPHLTRQDHR
ncbi:hypothetical protein SDC9_166524 [bioreactor metagenome]|uniref:Uncharacterized protein n=1 Tax=bioreactor metagenome TaxID=1076179 RepID=A0A645FX97_9ZZZZ